jgi:PTH1 family peptidyl-tRNA hydrolase
MKLIVGIGNPGKKYEKTRHNVGFVVVEELVRELRITNHMMQNDWKESKKGKLMYWWFEVGGEKVELIKPVTFMNRSGEVMAYVKKKHPELDLDDLYVIHDDLDIALGEYKIQKGKGPKDHKGLNSIYEKLGSKDFWHVRVGVENRTENKEQRTKGEDYVLQNFTNDEEKIIESWFY